MTCHVIAVPGVALRQLPHSHKSSDCAGRAAVPALIREAGDDHVAPTRTGARRLKSCWYGEAVTAGVPGPGRWRRSTSRNRRGTLAPGSVGAHGGLDGGAGRANSTEMRCRGANWTEALLTTG